MQRWYKGLIVWLCFVTPALGGVTDGSVDTRILSNMLIELKAQNANIVKQLSEVKATSDTMFQVRDTLTDIKAEADFWARFNPEAELQNIMQQYDDITGLDELISAKSWEQKFSILQNEVGKRFEKRPAEARKNDPNAENDIKKQLAALELTRKESAKQRELSTENGSAGLRDKDYNARNTSANQLTASYLAQQRASELEAELKERQQLSNDISFDADFTTYMRGGEALGTGLVSFITAIFDPAIVYKNFAYLAGITSFFPWFLVVFFMVRFLRESSDAMVGKAQLVDMVLSMNKTVVFFAVYSVFGVLLFSLILGLGNLFDRFGSMELIFNQITDLKSSLFTNEEVTKSFFDKVVSWAIDIANLPNAGLTFLLGKVSSLSFLVVSQLLKVLYACAMALLFAWGFVAISTMILKDDLKLIQGWKINIATLFIWVIVESIFLGIWSLVTHGASTYISQHYTNSSLGTTSITAYYLFLTVALSGAMLIKIIAPFLATRLVHNQSFGSTLGAPAAMIGAFTMQRMIQMTTAPAKSAGSLPDTEGLRKRDAVSRAFSDTANRSVRDVIQSAKKIGMGNISNE